MNYFKQIFENVLNEEKYDSYLNNLLKGTQHNESGMWSEGSWETEKKGNEMIVTLHRRDKDINFTTNADEIIKWWKKYSDEPFIHGGKKAKHVLEDLYAYRYRNI